jgi:hypothetical protein
MDSSASSSERLTKRAVGVRARSALLAAAGGLAFAVVLWGGYSRRWPWTGITGPTATLWDWLNLLLLPLVFAVLPTWARRDARLDPRTKSIASTFLLVFAILVVAGYTIPWAWTGFRGNTVWDWLGLIVLPVTLLLMPRFAELRNDWRRHHMPRMVVVGEDQGPKTGAERTATPPVADERPPSRPAPAA